MDPLDPPPAPTGAPAAPRRRWLAGAGVVAVAATVTAGVVAIVTGGDDDGLEDGSIRLEPVDAQTPNPFIDENLDLGDFLDGELQLGEIPTPSGTEAPELSDAVVTGLSGKVAAGDQAGLHGGSQTTAVCDVAALAELLADPAHADRGRAWADVQGIAVDEIAAFLDRLTPVRLRYDTRVTNHGFRDGRARPFQSILQAGTAVLVDHRGVPRARCSCGNPLTEPAPVDTDADAAESDALDLDHLAANPDDAWDGLDPAAVVTIEPGEERDRIVVADLETGRHVEQLPGLTYTVDQLRDALPTDAQLGRTYRDIERCPQGDSPRSTREAERAEQAAASCSPGPDGAQAFTQVTASTEGPQDVWWGNGDVFFASASTWTDPEARARWMQEARSNQERHDGPHDIPPTDLPGDDFEVGVRGDGTVEDFELDGWTGFTMVATHALAAPDGDTTPPLTEGDIYAVRGNALVWIVVVNLDDDSAAASDALRRYAGQIFEALP